MENKDNEKFTRKIGKAIEDTVNTVAEMTGKTIEEIKRMKREIVVSVRFDRDTMEKINMLVESGICKNKSEAVAYLTKKGIEVKEDLFEYLEDKLKEIRKIREDLRKYK